MENRDSSSVGYKIFNKSPLDTYPTFSLCFHGADFRWYHGDGLFDSIGMNPKEYVQILKGKTGSKYDYVYDSGLFRKIPLIFENISSTHVDQFGLNLSNILVRFEFRQHDIVSDKQYGNEEERKIFELFFALKTFSAETLDVEQAFYIGFQSADTVCFTRASHYQQDILRSDDILTLNRNVINNKKYRNIKMGIMIHYPGQLWRSVDNPRFYTRLGDRPWNDRTLELKISNVVTERKRSDSNIPCNPKITNEDTYLLHRIIKRTGCIPPYLISLFTNIDGFAECRKSHQLAEFNNYIEGYKGILHSYIPPCVDMKMIVLSNQDNFGPRDNETIIKVIYTEISYQEIENKQEFSFESFFSGVGGFIGIFLGYSLHQLPDLLHHISDRIRTKNRSSSG